MITLPELRRVVKGDVLNDEQTIQEFSHDASVFEVKPSFVIYPKDADDLKRLVLFVSEKQRAGEQVSLTARSAGTDMSGGPLSESLVLGFTKYFNRIKEVGSDYAVAEPGVYYRDFEKETLKKNLIMPSYPASRELCALGGIVANNSGGEKTLSYGKTERYVLELKAVLADGNEYTLQPLTVPELSKKMEQKNFEGEIYRKLFHLLDSHYDLVRQARPDVSKNSAGYYLWNVWDKRVFDLTQLFVGSQGTLGLITEATFHLVKRQAHSKLVVIYLKDLEPLVPIIEEVLKYSPTSFESYDDYSLKLAFHFLPDILKVVGLKNALAMERKFVPDIWHIMTHGFPKLVLLAEFVGETEAAVDEKLATVTSALQKFNVRVKATETEEEAKMYWTIRRESFNLLRRHVKGKRTAPFIDDFSVRPQYLPKFLPELHEILGQYKLIYTIAGHVGDGNFHIIPLMDLTQESERKIIPELSSKVYDLVLKYHGSITAEHNDGLIRSPYLEKMYGKEITGLFAEVKKIFDPLGIFNPGKKVGSSLEYAMRHIRRD